MLLTFIANMHPLKDKKGITVTNVFQKIWLDKCSEFYNRSMKLFLQNNDT